MPIDYSRYPANWKSEIRPRILNRENNRCKFCRIENGSIGYRDKEGKFYSADKILNALEETGYDYFEHELSNCFDKYGEPTKPIKIVLTVMHLDHDLSNNNDDNLAAACQYHHLKYDANHHAKNAKETNRKKKLLQNLF